MLVEMGVVYMMRIMFLIRTLNMGGAEHVLVDIANRMVNDGYTVTVLTMLDEGCYREKLDSKVKYISGFSSSSSFAKRVAMKLYLMLPSKLLSWLLIPKGYTHLVAFTEGYPTKIIAGCSRYGAKKVAWVHTDLYSNYQSKFVFGSEKMNRKCYDTFDQIICVSKDVKQGFIKRIGQHKSISVQYNPLNKMEIIERSKMNAPYPIDENGTFRIVSLGRLESGKGF